MILAILAALIALTMRIAAAEPIAEDEVLDELESGELDDQETEEALALAVDELSEDQLEELGIDDREIERGWITEPSDEVIPPRSPIGRVDLSFVYRRIDPIASDVRAEILVLGTWRR